MVDYLRIDVLITVPLRVEGGLNTVLWWEYGVMAAIFAGTLLLFAAGMFGFLRFRVQSWIGGAIGNFMTNLKRQSEEEGGGVSGGGSPGTFKLAGFEVTPEMIQLGMQLAEWAKKMGFLKGGGGGGTNPFLTP